MTDNIKFVSFYRFIRIKHIRLLKADIEDKLSLLNLKGSIILASEGINGMLSGAPEKLDMAVKFLIEQGVLTGREAKYSFHGDNLFRRMRVRIKKEILTFGVPTDAENRTGVHLNPEEWNEMIGRDDVLLIDCRNDYEVEYGTFEGAINPKTDKFTEMLEYTETVLADKKEKKIAMFCTGGIRCEKYSSYLLDKGFKNIYQLEGGVLRYLENVKRGETKWIGDCFIFDERIAIDHSLNAAGEK